MFFLFPIKVHIFWEGHKILRNLHLTFDYSTYSQKKSKVKISQNFVAYSEYMNFIICRPGFENLRTVQLKCRFTTGVKLFLNLHSYIPAYSLNYFMKYCSRKIQVLKNWNAPSEKITPNCGAASSVLHCSLDVLIWNSRETVGDVKMIIKCRWILKNFFLVL